MTMLTADKTFESSDRLNNRTILIVGDIKLGGRRIAGVLADRGYSVHVVDTASDGIRQANLGWVSLVIVHEPALGPDKKGMTTRLARDLEMPLVLVGESNNHVAMVNALENGADDYIGPSADLDIFMARITSVLRRIERTAALRYLRASPQLYFDGWTMDLERRTVVHETGRDPHLSDSEFRLLRVLAEHPNQVLSREDILLRTQARKGGSTVRSVDIQVTRLRRKIEKEPGRPRLIRTIRHEGYMLAANVITRD